MKKLLNKWVNKQTILVFILSILLSTTTFTLAESKLKINVNPYPVIVNGVKINTTGYNINGSTYLKTRDVATTVGVPIEFKDKKIYVGTIGEYTGKVTSDGIKAIKFEDKYLISVGDICIISEKYEKIFGGIGKTDPETNESYILHKIKDKEGNVLYEFKRYIELNHCDYIELSQYENEILPILKK